MIRDNDLQAHVERQEAWLREIYVEPPPPDSKRFKLAARVAAGELWLREVANDPSPADLAESVKRAVRAELARSPVRRSGVGRSRLWWWSAAASIAACLGVLLLSHQPAATWPSDSAIAAFSEYELDELSPSLAMLGDDLWTVESSRLNDDPEWSNSAQYDDMIDSLGEVFPLNSLEDAS